MERKGQSDTGNRANYQDRNEARTRNCKVLVLDHECKGPCLGVRARLNPGE
jgi:hypothetical protein